MKYFLTGGAGFIGSHLTTALLNRGDSVTIYDDLSTGSHKNISHLKDRTALTVVEGNILDQNKMAPYIEQCDQVLHFAAAVGVFTIVDKPLKSLLTNLKGTENVIEAASKFNKPFFLASTSEVYGKNTNVPLHEESDRVLGSPLKSRWSYSEAKAIDESLAIFYHYEKNLDVKIARFFNTVGPKQVGHYGMVVPRFVKAAINNEPITVYGDGSQSRAFCNVSDALKAILLLLETSKATGDVFNIGNNEEITIKALAQRVIQLTDSSSTIEYLDYDKAYGKGFEDMQRRVPDISKMEKSFGWKPTISIDQTILEIANDLRNN